MADIRRVPSSVFRVTYAGLEEAVAVTAVGRVIAHYIPVGVAIDDRFIAGLRPGEPASRPGQESVAESSGPAAGGSPGRTEAPDDNGGPMLDRAKPGPTAPQTAGMTQADRDKVLRRVATKEK